MQARCLVLGMRKHDLEQCAQLSFLDLQQTLRLVNIKRVPLEGRVSGPDKLPEWVLQEVVFNGRQYLMDRENHKVFHDAWTDAWPQLAGWMRVRKR